MTQTSNRTEKRLVKLGTARKSPKTEKTLLQPNAKQNTQHNSHNHNEQYLQSTKLDVLTFDVHLDP